MPKRKGTKDKSEWLQVTPIGARLDIPEITLAPSARRGVMRSRKKLQAWAKRSGRKGKLLQP